MSNNEARLQHRVINALARDPHVDATRIVVTTSLGVVTLVGSVPSFEQEIAAVQAVRSLEDVRGVDDRLTIDLKPVRRRATEPMRVAPDFESQRLGLEKQRD